MVDVAIIMINFNTAQYTLEAIAAVRSHTADTLSYQIIVVDNNSEENDFQHLKQHFPEQAHISLHPSPINTGFGGGNMHGVPFAAARYLLFLNNDAMLLNDCLSLLTRFMDAHPRVGVCTAQNYDEHQKFVPSFDHDKGLRRLLFGRGFLEKLHPNAYPKRKREYTQPLAVNWVNGAFMFFRTEAFEQAGGFDTDMFLYFEEMDICYRLRKMGYSSMLVPAAKILHYQGVSIGKSEAINKEGYISYLHVIRKNYGGFKHAIVSLYLTLVFLIKPKKWYLLKTIVNPKRHDNSLKHLQKERLHVR